MKDCIEFKAIERFFEDKHIVTKHDGNEERLKFLKPLAFHAGGRIPKSALYRPDTKMLVRIEMIPAVDILYAALAKVKYLVKTKYDENVGKRLVLKVLGACGRRGIPQNFVPGIMLMYAELCEGCPWRHLVAPILKERQEALDRIERLKASAARLRLLGKFDEADLVESKAKLDPSDWPEKTTQAVADFLKEARRYR